MTDPTAASSETATALQSALDAVHQEREALTQRLEEVDRLIADLQQAADTRSYTAAQPPRRQAARTSKGATKKAAQTRSQRKQTRKAATKKGTRRKQTTKAAAKKATQRTQATTASTAAITQQKTSGARRGRPPAGEVGRTDRVVQIIAEADQPLSTGEVRSRLQQYEPDVTSKLVSASLSYAQRKNRIHKTDEGRWVAAAGESGTAQGAQIAEGAQASTSSR